MLTMYCQYIDHQQRVFSKNSKKTQKTNKKIQVKMPGSETLNLYA
ncbi:hypothetical protein [Mucilaginibacter rubeus]|nr:hypothetical protein [Mucilaginibacter rubeus]